MEKQWTKCMQFFIKKRLQVIRLTFAATLVISCVYIFSFHRSSVSSIINAPRVLTNASENVEKFVKIFAHVANPDKYDASFGHATSADKIGANFHHAASAATAKSDAKYMYSFNHDASNDKSDVSLNHDASADKSDASLNHDASADKSDASLNHAASADKSDASLNHDASADKSDASLNHAASADKSDASLNHDVSADKSDASVNHTESADNSDANFNHAESADKLEALFGHALSRDFFPEWFWTMPFTELCEKFNARKTGGSSSQNKLTFDTASRPAIPPNWMRFQSNIRQSSVYDPKDPAVEGLLRDMSVMPIIKIEEIPKGKQFKLRVKFSDDGLAVLKPYRYYGRNDRHHAEIAAFHLDRLMGYYRVPPTVGRRVHVGIEMAPILPPSIQKTLSIKEEDGSTCFYGRCDRCKESNPVCGSPDYVDVSLMQFLPNNDVIKFKTEPTPWKKWKHGQILPNWVSESHMCKRTRREFDSGQWLLAEILDVVYFDMIIDNDDRHQHAYFGYFQNQTNVILFDSGKGFINASDDRFFRNFVFERGGCCLIKKTTLLRLVKAALGPDSLSGLLARSLTRDPLAPVLTDDHLEAVDRRVGRILAYLRECIEKRGVEAVVLDDMSDGKRTTSVNG